MQETWEPGGEPSEAERIALAAMEVEDEVRRVFVNAQCAGDPILAAAVLDLLAEFAENDTWFRRVAIGSGALLGATEPGRLEEEGAGGAADVGPPQLPDFIGPYRVMERLGQGGMGVVYLAEREDRDFRMRVAVKVLHPHLASGPFRRRFLGEQQILARLSHPGIARLIDGGVLDEGTPYLVMEFVEGDDLVTWADQRELGVRERVRLFQQVCHAVAYAHRNLVVHRDLKPSNTRVTGEGEVKLLDFGIARVLEVADGGEGEITRFGPLSGVPMTPAYASPEQLRGEAIGTPSDVYSMGILLRRLLHSPDEEPAPARDAGPPPLPSGLDDDLAAILGKAARPEPEERYGSAVELGDDLARFMDGRPVLARAGSTRYRLKRLLLRHRWAAATGGIAFLALLAGGVGLVSHSARVESERDVARLEAERAEAVTAFLVDLFDVAGDGSPMDTIRAGALLRLGEDRLRERLDPHPLIRASLLEALGRANERLGAVGAPERLLEERVQVLRAYHGPQHVEVARALVSAAAQRNRGHHWHQGEALLQEALGILEVQGGRSPSGNASETKLRATVLRHLAVSLRHLELPDSAVAVGRAAMALDRTAAAGDQDLLPAMASLASALRGSGDVEGAESLLREGLALLEAVPLPSPRNHALFLNNLASALRARGAMEEAELRFRQALEVEIRLSGEDSPAAETIAANLSGLLVELGRRPEAEALARSVEEAVLTTHPPDHWRVGRARARQGRAWLGSPECVRGRAFLEDAREIYIHALGADHPWTAGLDVDLAECGIALGRTGEAEGLLSSALSVLLGARNPDRRFIRHVVDLLAGIYEAEGRPAEAEALRRQVDRE